MPDDDLQTSASTVHSRSPTLTDKSEEEPRSPLFLSLEHCLRNPYSVSSDWIDNIADINNNPRKLSGSSASYNDNSLHWVDQEGNILPMVFPAVLNIPGKYSKIGPYFNLMGDQDVVKVSSSRIFFMYLTSSPDHQKPTIPVLSKMKAVFELSTLTLHSARDIPQDAIDCSSKAMTVLQSLYSTLENKKNECESYFLSQ